MQKIYGKALFITVPAYGISNEPSPGAKYSLQPQKATEEAQLWLQQLPCTVAGKTPER